MNRFVIGSIALMILLSSCATTGRSTYTENNGGLPEIAPYDEPTYEPLPDVVPVE